MREVPDRQRWVRGDSQFPQASKVRSRTGAVARNENQHALNLLGHFGHQDEGTIPNVKFRKQPWGDGSRVRRVSDTGLPTVLSWDVRWECWADGVRCLSGRIEDGQSGRR